MSDEPSPQSAPRESTGSATDPTAERDLAALSLSVPSMDCPSCAGKIESSVSDLDGIADIDPRTTSGTVVVAYNPAQTTPAAIRDRVAAAGYEIVDTDEPHDPLAIWTSGRALRTATGGVLLLIGLVFEWVIPAANPTLTTIAGAAVGLDTIAYVLAAAAPGLIILRNGYASLRTHSLDIDLLMTGGILGALAVNLPFEAATLAVLFSIAELLERYSMDRARGSLRELMALSPETATVRRDGEEQVVAAETVAVGDRVIVRPGEKIPVDGVIQEGTSAIDESPITGESVPADKEPGNEVYAGSLTETGYIEVEATAPTSESTIARVIDLVEAAEGEETETEQFVDRFAAVYTPIVVVAALVTIAVPPLIGWGAFTEWFVRGLTLLVIACPCAFVISTPVSVVSGLTSAARNGVLIKGGSHLEAMGDVEAVALDKTGTLTTGDLGVTDVIPLNDTTEDELLDCASTLEQRSEHPIADAIVDRARDADATGDRPVKQFEAVTGEGVRAEIDGITHYAGKPSLFTELGFTLDHAHLETDGGLTAGAVDVTDGTEAETTDGQPTVADEAADCEHGQYVDLLAETIPRLQQAGKTVVLVGTDEKLEGLIAIADTVRPEAKWAVDQLKASGIERVVMLTGDNERTARAIGAQVGVDAVQASLLPEAKGEAVRDLREAHPGGVAMVGDGINDAPALATATVGVAMGAAGTDTALETADIALMADDLSRLPYLHTLAETADGVIRQNIWSSLAVKLLLAIAAPFGYVSVLGAIVIGDMGMSLGVTGNAMRLAGVTPDEPSTTTD